MLFIEKKINFSASWNRLKTDKFERTNRLVLTSKIKSYDGIPLNS